MLDDVAVNNTTVVVSSHNLRELEDVCDHVLSLIHIFQAACPWYPPTNLSTFKYKDAEECAASMESLLLGYNIMRNIKEAYNLSLIHI